MQTAATQLDIFAQNHVDLSKGRFNAMSKLAFETVRPRISERHKSIMNLIFSDSNLCQEEILNKLELSLKNSGRFSELKKLNYIKVAGSKKYNNRNVELYQLTEVGLSQINNNVLKSM